MISEQDVPKLKQNQPLNWIAHWLPLIPFTIPAGIYSIGLNQPTTTRPYIFIGNSRRLAYQWQRILGDLGPNLVVVDTAGRSLSETIADETVTLETLATLVSQIVLAEEGNSEPPPIFLAISPAIEPLLVELETLTRSPHHLISPDPSIAVETIRTGHPSTSTTAPRSSTLYPLAFNLALFMSLITCGFSLLFGSEYSWLWFLLPWLACLGLVILPTIWPCWPRMARGLIWGIGLSIPLTGWQAMMGIAWSEMVGWVVATLLICVWAGWRMTLTA